MNSIGTDAPAWIPTRDEALRRLAAFVPSAGRAYAAERNYDRGPQRRENVSTLSPYIRHRVLSETEVLAAVLARHTPGNAFKYVQEVFWRTYWKGWLQAHPSAWSRYLAALDDCYARLENERDLAGTYGAAVAGRTGIDAFDAWAKELVEIGYLHNHARMWFASTWIFTLRLPWELGADFFIRNLLDGDPASNTLSWRWVAGLHTPGKTYRATRDNIRRYTDARFDPGEALAVTTPALREAPIPLEPQAPPPAPAAAGGEPSLLVLHDDDLGAETLEVRAPSVAAVCVLVVPARRSPSGVAGHVTEFTRGLATDALDRAARRFDAAPCGAIDGSDPRAAAEAVVRVARECSVSSVVAPLAPVGPVRPALDAVATRVRESGAEYCELTRRYDAVAWPYATRGFYGLGTRVPEILRSLGLTAG